MQALKNARMAGVVAISFLGRSLRDLSEARGIHLHPVEEFSATREKKSCSMALRSNQAIEEDFISSACRVANSLSTKASSHAQFLEE